MPLLMRALGGNRSRIGGKLIRCEASLPLARDARLCPHQDRDSGRRVTKP